VLASAMAVTKTRIRNTARPRNAALLLIQQTLKPGKIQTPDP
jgi:hypothetical protein